MKNVNGKIVATLTAALLAVGCADKSVTAGGGEETLDINVKNIYVRQTLSNVSLSEYKIDFENKEAWRFNGDRFSSWTRDKLAGDEGYNFAGNLSNRNIKDFFERSEERGFFSWEERYGYPRCFAVSEISQSQEGFFPNCYAETAGGHNWQIDIAYVDGSVKKMGGHMAYPETWNDMSQAFEDLVGKEVLWVF